MLKLEDLGDQRYAHFKLIPNTENSLESSLLPVDEVEEEEAWLYWIDGNKEPHGKSIRHLAQDSKGNHKMDIDVITYYRMNLQMSSWVTGMAVLLDTHRSLRLLCSRAVMVSSARIS
ncbi:hypothetical protein CRUP_001966 [Coryphaenoides rupestris]|nr:hypothetical protein CRUP_001966 [Coryphaenoides rupestris]